MEIFKEGLTFSPPHPVKEEQLLKDIIISSLRIQD